MTSHIIKAVFLIMVLVFALIGKYYFTYQAGKTLSEILAN